MARVVRTAVLVLVASILLGFALGGTQGGRAATAGGLAGALIQGAAAFVLFRRRSDSTVGFLGGFARASAYRVFGGVIAVTLGVAAARLPPLAFLGAFGATYVALEIAIDLQLLRDENRRVDKQVENRTDTGG